MRSAFEYVVIALGIVAPTIELSTRICTGLFFDPLPTLFHVLLFYLVPIAMLTAKLLIIMPYTERRGRIAMICLSYSIVVAVAYSIWFLPISWISLLGILAMGIGTLGLTPFAMLVAIFSIYSNWHKWLPEESRAGFNPRFTRYTLLILPLLVILWWHPIVIKTGELMLKSDSSSIRYGGLELLDCLASEAELQRRCFDRNVRLFGAEMYDDELLREAYYFIYGTRPGISRQGENILGVSEWSFDTDRGSNIVGQRQPGLLLAESSLDAAVETAGGNGYYEWTMVFENAGIVPREARAAIQLPPYSVVSTASLWIDGEEREAAYGTTSKVRSAYRSTVRRRCDPLLITMVGPEQVQMQCFPVPAGGSMKIRFGVTCPLVDGTRLYPPRIMESNFAIPDEMLHNVWVEGDVAAEAIVAGTPSHTGGAVLKLTNDDLESPNTYFTFECDPPAGYSFAEGAMTLEPVEYETAETAPVVLIDGREDVLKRLGDFDWSGMKPAGLIIAQPYGSVAWDGSEPVRGFISDQTSYGGVDPCEPLLRAINRADSIGAPVIWLHGSLPSNTREELALEQVMRRSRHPVHVVALAVSGEVNSLITDVTSMRWFDPIAPSGDIQKDMKLAMEVASRLPAVTEGQVPLGGRASSGYVFSGGDDVAMSHPYRLFLYSRIMDEWYRNGQVSDELAGLAITSRLVTPVSGAVVLENDRQYQAADLDPSVGAENIPKIPEPEFYLLLGIALLAATMMVWRKRPWALRVSQ